MKNDTYSINEVLLAIASMPTLAKRLLGKGKKYDLLLNEILKFDYYNDERDTPLLKGKDIQKLTSLNSQKSKALLVEIYNDFINLISNESSPLKINKVIYEVYVRFVDRMKTFYCSLPTVPRVGEAIEIPFLKPIMEIRFFYVIKVQYEIRNDCQVIIIWLAGEEENTYKKFITDKAEYEGRYDYMNDEIF